MAQAFNLTARINLQGPYNLRPIVSKIKRDIGSIKPELKFKLDPASANSVKKVTAEIKKLDAATKSANKTVGGLNTTLQALSASLNSSAAASKNAANASAATTRATANAAKATNQARTAVEEFGRQSGLAVKRFAAFSTVTAVVFGVTSAITSAFKEFVTFNKEIVRLSQVTNTSVSELGGISNEIRRLSTSLGVASSDLISVASTLAQAGLNAEETKTALEALAKSALAPSFENIAQTTEGAIASMRQFGIQSNELEVALGSINAVAAAFAVEAGDIIAAIQRTGGVFAAASRGVSEGSDALNEFIAVFTSVRQTTRESAETIATGLRTIFTRIQRSSTIDLLKQYGIELRDLEGKFVGPFEAVKRLSEGLSSLDPRSADFARISEELGGFRQIGKVIPLIQEFAVAQEALKVAQKGSGSLAKDAITAQQSLAVQFIKTRENLLALVAEIADSTSFKVFSNTVFFLTNTLIKLGSILKPLLPLLLTFGAIKIGGALNQYTKGFGGVFGFGGGGGGAGSGGAPGSPGPGGGGAGGGNQPLTGALTLNTTATNALTQIITNLNTNINSLNQNITNTNSLLASRSGPPSVLNGGGKVLGFNRGGVVPGSGRGDKVPALLEPGEVVMNNSAVNQYGRGNLVRMNKYVGGGSVKEKIGELPAKKSILYESRPGFTIEDSEGEVETQINPIPIKVTSQDFSTMVENIRDMYRTNKKQFTKFRDEKVIGSRGETPKSIYSRKSLSIDDNNEIEDSYISLPKPEKSSSWAKGRAFEDLLASKYGSITGKITSSVDDNSTFSDIIADQFAPLDFEKGDAKFEQKAAAYFSRGNAKQLNILSKRFRDSQLVLPWTPNVDSFVGPQALDPTSVFYPENPEQTKKDFDTFYEQQYNRALKSSSQTMEAARQSGSLADYKGGKIQKFPVGGMVGRVPMKKSIDDDRASAVYDNTRNKEVEGSVYAPRIGPDLYSVDTAGVSKPGQGYGVPLYDAVLQQVSAKKAWLTSSRTQVSEQARSVWDGYRKKRPDVKNKLLPIEQWNMDPLFNGQIEGEPLNDLAYQFPENLNDLNKHKKTWPQKDHPVWSLQHAYQLKAKAIKKSMGGPLQFFQEGSPGSVKKRGIDWKNLSKGRGKKGARGARKPEYDIPNTENFVEWAQGIYSEYDADPSLPTASYMNMSMPVEIAYANMLLGEFLDKGGAGLSTGKKFIVTPPDKIHDALRPYLVPNPNNPSELGFFGDDKILAFQRANKTELQLREDQKRADELSKRKTTSKMQRELFGFALKGMGADIEAGNFSKDKIETLKEGLSEIAKNPYLQVTSLPRLKGEAAPASSSLLDSIGGPLSEFRKSGGQTSLSGVIPEAAAKQIEAALPGYIDSVSDDSQKLSKAKTTQKYFRSFVGGATAEKPGHATAFAETINQMLKGGAIQGFADGGMVQRFMAGSIGGVTSSPSPSSLIGGPFHTGTKSKDGKSWFQILQKIMKDSSIPFDGNNIVIGGQRVSLSDALSTRQLTARKFRERVGETNIPKLVSLRDKVLEKFNDGGREVDASNPFNLSESQIESATPVAIVGLMSDFATKTRQFKKIVSGVPLSVNVGALQGELGVEEALAQMRQGDYENLRKTAGSIFPGIKLADLGDEELDMLGRSNAEGYSLETILALVGAKGGISNARNRAIDFEGGLPEDVASRFGVPGGIFTQAKRTLSSDSVSDALKGIVARMSGLRMSDGGLIKRFASGGTVLAKVSNGEAFVPPNIAKKIGYSKLDKMNQADRNGMKGFATGGISTFKGAGNGTSDSIGPIGLPTGSYVIREKATKALGFNKGGSVGVRKFAGGGSPTRDEAAIIAALTGTLLPQIEKLASTFAQLEGDAAAFGAGLSGAVREAGSIIVSAGIALQTVGASRRVTAIAQTAGGIGAAIGGALKDTTAKLLERALLENSKSINKFDKALQEIEIAPTEELKLEATKRLEQSFGELEKSLRTSKPGIDNLDRLNKAGDAIGSFTLTMLTTVTALTALSTASQQASISVRAQLLSGTTPAMATRLLAGFGRLIPAIGLAVAGFSLLSEGVKYYYSTLNKTSEQFSRLNKSLDDTVKNNQAYSLSNKNFVENILPKYQRLISKAREEGRPVREVLKEDSGSRLSSMDLRFRQLVVPRAAEAGIGITPDESLRDVGDRLLKSGATGFIDTFNKIIKETEEYARTQDAISFLVEKQGFEREQAEKRITELSQKDATQVDTFAKSYNAAKQEEFYASRLLASASNQVQISFVNLDNSLSKINAMYGKSLTNLSNSFEDLDRSANLLAGQLDFDLGATASRDTQVLENLSGSSNKSVFDTVTRISTNFNIPPELAGPLKDQVIASQTLEKEMAVLLTELSKPGGAGNSDPLLEDLGKALEASVGTSDEAKDTIQNIVGEVRANLERTRGTSDSPKTLLDLARTSSSLDQVFQSGQRSVKFFIDSLGIYDKGLAALQQQNKKIIEVENTIMQRTLQRLAVEKKAAIQFREIFSEDIPLLDRLDVIDSKTRESTKNIGGIGPEGTTDVSRIFAERAAAMQKISELREKRTSGGVLDKEERSQLLSSLGAYSKLQTVVEELSNEGEKLALTLDEVNKRRNEFKSRRETLIDILKRSRDPIQAIPLRREAQALQSVTETNNFSVETGMTLLSSSLLQSLPEALKSALTNKILIKMGLDAKPFANDEENQSITNVLKFLEEGGIDKPIVKAIQDIIAERAKIDKGVGEELNSALDQRLKTTVSIFDIFAKNISETAGRVVESLKDVAVRARPNDLTSGPKITAESTAAVQTITEAVKTAQTALSPPLKSLLKSLDPPGNRRGREPVSTLVEIDLSPLVDSYQIRLVSKELQNRIQNEISRMQAEGKNIAEIVAKVKETLATSLSVSQKGMIFGRRPIPGISEENPNVPGKFQLTDEAFKALEGLFKLLNEVDRKARETTTPTPVPSRFAPTLQQGASLDPSTKISFDNFGTTAQQLATALTGENTSITNLSTQMASLVPVAQNLKDAVTQLAGLFEGGKMQIQQTTTGNINVIFDTPLEVFGDMALNTRSIENLTGEMTTKLTPRIIEGVRAIT